MNNEKVVIFTINYNQSLMTLECVDSILRSTYNNYKLIVIDNGSTEEEFNFLIESIDSNVLVERINENCGYVGGINRGFLAGSKLNPDYFLIMNNDTIIDSNAVQYFVEAGEKYNQKAIISGKVYHFDRPNIIQYAGSFFSDRRYLKETYPGKDEEDVGQCDIEEERDMLDDIFWLVSNKIYKDVGNYSDNFFLYGEQADFALQAVKKGYRLIYTPKAKIWHKGMVTTGGGNILSPPVNFWRKKSSVIYLYRNTKRQFFYLNYFRSISKLIVKNILNSLNLRNAIHKKSDYAALIGYFYGIDGFLITSLILVIILL